MTPKIIIDHENTKKQIVQIRQVSLTHWEALKKLAVLHDMSNAEYLAYLVERELERISNEQ